MVSVLKLKLPETKFLEELLHTISICIYFVLGLEALLFGSFEHFYIH